LFEGAQRAVVGIVEAGLMRQAAGEARRDRVCRRHAGARRVHHPADLGREDEARPIDAAERGA
jgi:hypothetical protein